jgi:hypothetical protein
VLEAYTRMVHLPLVPAQLIARLGACFTIGLIPMATLPSPGHGQALQSYQVTYLDGQDVLHVPVPGPPPFVFPLGEGGWLAGLFQEQWAWGEFDEEGALRRVGGTPWSGGGPGEFRRVLATFPVAGDTLLVVEPFVLTRMLRNGAYIDRRFIAFDNVSGWARLGHRIWIGGAAPPGQPVPLLMVSETGEVQRFTLPPGRAEEVGSSAKPVNWDGQLWVWVYPRGPFHRIDLESGRSLETWMPPATASRPAPWRAFPTGGPGGSLILRFDPALEWVVFGRDRDFLFSHPVPDDLRGVSLIDSTYAVRNERTDHPVPFNAQIRILRYAIADSRDR